MSTEPPPNICGVNKSPLTMFGKIRLQFYSGHTTVSFKFIVDETLETFAIMGTDLCDQRVKAIRSKQKVVQLDTCYCIPTVRKPRERRNCCHYYLMASPTPKAITDLVVTTSRLPHNCNVKPHRWLSKPALPIWLSRQEVSSASWNPYLQQPLLCRLLFVLRDFCPTDGLETSFSDVIVFNFIADYFEVFYCVVIDFFQEARCIHLHFLYLSKLVKTSLVRNFWFFTIIVSGNSS